MRILAALAICLWLYELPTAAPPRVDLRAYLQLEGIEGDDASLFVKVFNARERGSALRLSEALVQYYAKATGKEAATEPLLVAFVFPAKPEDGKLVKPLCYKVLREVQLEGIDEFSIRFQRSSSQPENTATVIGLAWERYDGHDKLVAIRESFHLKDKSWISVSLDEASISLAEGKVAGTE